MPTIRIRHAGYDTRPGRYIIAVAFILAVSVLTAVPVQAGDPGDAGALFLRIGVGARAAAMGEGFVAVGEDASSVYWNPGAMAPVLGTNIMLVHNEYFHTVRFEQAAITHETNYGTIGLSFTGMFMDDLERREDTPTEIPLGEYSVYDVSASLGFARYVLPNVSVGATVKPVHQKIDEYSATGFAFDIGVYHVARIDGVKLGAVVGNLGAPMKFVTESYALPRYIKVGGSYEREETRLRGRLLFTVDGVFPNDGTAKQHIGAEYTYDRMFSLRGGYKAGYDSQGGTFGAGVRYDKIDVDYAFLLIGNDLGNSHRISISIRP